MMTDNSAHRNSNGGDDAVLFGDLEDGIPDDVIAALEEDLVLQENTSKPLSFFSFLWHKLCCKYILPVFVVFGATIGILMAAGVQFDKDTLPPFLAKIIFESRNGWDNVNPDDLPRWSTRSNSPKLQLEVLNALEDSWQSYFDKSVHDWNNGDPNVVDLQVKKVDPDPNCDFVRGKIVVCNGNEGSTEFHGLNHVLVKGNTITASVAKLNEYYMKDASSNRKAYTMCHELGHAFGLPHADESYHNINLGNCMDYTSRPWSNTSPDKHTFELLQKVYFPFQTATTTTTTTTSQTSWSAALPGFASDRLDSVPQGIVQQAQRATSKLEQSLGTQSNEEWVQIKRDDHTAVFQMDLGDGYSVHTHFLLAN